MTQISVVEIASGSISVVEVVQAGASAVEVTLPDNSISVVEVTIPGPQGPAGGGGGVVSLTPWTENVDANGFNLLFDDGTGILSSEAGNPELLLFESVASAVNYLKITNAATLTAPSISALGSDTDIGFEIAVKGGGGIFPTETTAARIYTGAGNQASLVARSDGTGNTGPGFEMFHDSATPAANDFPGAFEMYGRDSVNNVQLYAAMWAQATDVTSGSEDGKLIFYSTRAGSTYVRELEVYSGVKIQTTSGGAGGTAPGLGNLGFATSGTGIKDGSANELLIFSHTASAVNYLQIANAATGNAPTVSANGSDANVGLNFSVKGQPTPCFKFDLGSVGYGEFRTVGSDAGTGGPGLVWHHNSASPAVGDDAAWWEWHFNNSLGAEKVAGALYVGLIDTTSGSEDGELKWYTNVAGTTYTQQARFGNGIIIGSGSTYPGTGNLAFADLKGIFDGAGNEQLIFDQVASAVNYLQISNAATGGNPTISALGNDTNIGLTFTAKGGLDTPIVFNMGGAALAKADFVATDNSGTGSPSCNLYANNPAPFDFMTMGRFAFQGNDSALNRTNYALVSCDAEDQTDATEDGILHFYTMRAASISQPRLSLGDGLYIGGWDIVTADPGRGFIGFDDLKGVKDDNANEMLIFDTVTSAVNYWQMANAATGVNPIFSPGGDDANIGLTFTVKGGPTSGAASGSVVFNMGSGDYPEFLMTSTGALTGGPFYQIYHNSASPAAGDDIAGNSFRGNDSLGNKTNYAEFYVNLLDTTNATEDAEVIHSACVAGVLTEQLKIGNGLLIGGATTYPGTGNVAVGDSKGIFDSVGNEILLFARNTDSPSFAANYLVVTNAANGEAPSLESAGDDTDIDLQLSAKGAGKVYGHNESFIIAASDESTALTTGTSKVKFRMPYMFTLTGIRASLSTAQTSGATFTVGVNENGNSILSTDITIDNGEKTTTTAAVPPVISDSLLADDAEITIDIDQVGDGTAKGLKITLIGHQ